MSSCKVKVRFGEVKVKDTLSSHVGEACFGLRELLHQTRHDIYTIDSTNMG